MAKQPAAKRGKKEAPSLPEESFFVFDTDTPLSRGKSVPLITFDNNRFDVNPDAIELLHTLQSPLAVVAVAGMYRTGKSFLLNRVILGKQNAFTVGPTTRACTKGVWLWSEPLTVQGDDGREVKVLVIDTEGIGAPTADATHDTRIFALGLLLSTYFIYNSVGSIDEQALNNMSLVTNLSSQIRQSSVQDASEYPAFLWVVRDFALQLQNSEGAAISSSEYLEDALRDCDMSHPTAPAKNRVRSSLRDFFPDRDCFTMVRPCTLENQLQALDSLPNKSLRHEFVAQAVELRERVFHTAASRLMKVQGVELNGSMLAALCTQYVQAMNEGQVPVIQDAWSYVCDAQRFKCEEALVAHCSQACATHVASAARVSELRQLIQDTQEDVLTQYCGTCAKLYSSELLGPHVTKLSTRLDEIGKAHVVQFEVRLKGLVSDAVSQALAQVESQLMRGLFKQMSEFRSAVFDAHAALAARFGWEEQEDVSGGDASCQLMWLCKVEALLWRAISEFYGGKESEVNRLQQQLESSMMRGAEEVRALTVQHQQALAGAMEAHKFVVSQLEDQARESGERLKGVEALVDTRSQELVQLTATTAAQVAALEQEVDQERLRASGAEQQVSMLREELEEMEADARMVQEQARQLSEASLEKERLRGELSTARRQLGEERKSFEALEQSLLKESREMQARALSSLSVLKEAKRAEVSAAKAARDQAVTRVATLEATAESMQQQCQKLEGEADRLRTHADELESRLTQVSKEWLSKQAELERACKSLEREKDALASKMREDKMRAEQEFVLRLQQVETRAVRAEASEAERRRQLDMAEERWQRKRARTSDEESDNKSLELAKKETEVSWLRAQKMEVDAQVAQLRKENDQLQVQKRTLERSLDNEKTRLTLEYEAKLAALQQQISE